MRLTNLIQLAKDYIKFDTFIKLQSSKLNQRLTKYKKKKSEINKALLERIPNETDANELGFDTTILSIEYTSKLEPINETFLNKNLNKYFEKNFSKYSPSKRQEIAEHITQFLLEQRTSKSLPKLKIKTI